VDLLAIVRTMWRFKIPSLVVVLATVAGCAAVFLLVPPVYEASASYLLLEPKPPPTEAEIEKDPGLKRKHFDNPYLRFSDSSVISNVVSRRVNENTAKEKLIKAGADDRYEVSPSNRFGFSSPIIDVTARGDSPEAALTTVRLVGGAVGRELKKVQAAEKVDNEYMFTAVPVESPETATERSSGKLRALLGVLGLGGVALMVLLSSLQAWVRRRAPQPSAVEPVPIHLVENPAPPKNLQLRGLPRAAGSPPQADPSSEAE
jgi:uncharacterized protein involved in exopolysaccharide biosynthesis